VFRLLVATELLETDAEIVEGVDPARLALQSPLVFAYRLLVAAFVLE
jgi:hypothetical protein